MIGFIDEYINKKGIVVEHPGTLQQQLDAIIAYAETVEEDCLKAERKLSIAVEALKWYEWLELTGEEHSGGEGNSMIISFDRKIAHEAIEKLEEK